MSKKKTHEEYVSELAIKNPNLQVIEEYVSAQTKITHRCLLHNIEWKVTPTNVLSGKKCPLCANENRRKHMSLNENDYKINLNYVLPHISLIGSYINARTKTMHYCSIHDIQWLAIPNNLLHGGYGCPKCSKEIFQKHTFKPYAQYVNELSSIYPKIKCVGNYTCATVDALHKCLICGTEWMAEPRNILLGHCSCPQCRPNRTKTHDEYVLELKNVNTNIEVLENYINSYTPILHRCKKDGNIWKAKPANILFNNQGCPQCKESHGEKAVRIYLEKNNIIFERQKTFDDCKDKNLLKFDFYLPYHNSVIEYDGIQHYRPIEWFGGDEEFNNIVKRDNIKNKYCQKNKIKILRIPYYNYSRIDEKINNFLFI